MRGGLLALGVVLVGIHLPAVEIVTDFQTPENGGTSSAQWAGNAEGWSNAFPARPALARKYGVGVAPVESSGGQSGLLLTCSEPEPLVSVTVTCVASGSGAAKAEHVLGLQLDEGILETRTFSFGGAVNTPVELTFAYTTLQQFKTLRLTNESSGKNYFEIQSVSRQTAYSPIVVAAGDVTLPANGEVAVTKPFIVSLDACSGGSGEYVRFVWHFNGETQETDELNEAITFVAPAEEGTLPLTLQVTDSLGKEASFSYDIRVLPWLEPEQVEISEISRTGFALAWKQRFADAVSRYRIDVKRAGCLSVAKAFAPRWVLAEGAWQLETPIDLRPFTTGRKLSSAFLIPSYWAGTALEASFDGGKSWVALDTTFLTLMKRFTFRGAAAIPISATELRLRTAAETPPPLFTLSILYPSLLQRIERDTAEDASTRLVIADLPAGEQCQVSITACFVRDDGTTVSLSTTSDPFSLQAVPSFSSIDHYPNTRQLVLTWPAGEEALSAELTFHAQYTSATALPSGLYLTRVLLLANPAGKAIALTNTSSRPIPLRGSYKLRASRPKEDGTSVVYTWDFSVPVEATDGTTTKTYPYVLEAGQEMVFYAQSLPLPADIRANAIASTAQALRAFTANYTLTLLGPDGEPINALSPQANMLVRLAPNSLDATETYPVTASDTDFSPLYVPWYFPVEDRIFRTSTYARGPAKLLSYTLPSAEERTHIWRIWVEARLFDGTSPSALTSLLLWEPGAPGYRFIIR